jgi:hypothetical protein
MALCLQAGRSFFSEIIASISSLRFILAFMFEHALISNPGSAADPSSLRKLHPPAPFAASLHNCLRLATKQPQLHNVLNSAGWPLVLL